MGFLAASEICVQERLHSWGSLAAQRSAHRELCTELGCLQAALSSEMAVPCSLSRHTGFAWLTAARPVYRVSCTRGTSGCSEVSADGGLHRGGSLCADHGGRLPPGNSPHRGYLAAQTRKISRYAGSLFTCMQTAGIQTA